MMKTLTISDELYDLIVNYSKELTCPEKSGDDIFNAYDWFGGNFDDTYEDGTIDGHIELSKRIMNET